jgi:transposase
MHKAIQSTSDKGFARRLIALLALHEGKSIVEVHELIGAARSSIGRWINWYTECGIEGLKSLPAGRPSQLPMDAILTMLTVLIQLSPQDLGYQRSRWSTELLTIEINRLFQSSVAASTVRRWLPKAGIVWRRAAPTLCIRDPHRAEKLEKISLALENCSARNPVFYEDEVDIDLNPKIGADWCLKGQQKRVVTPGCNEKHYLAGALHSSTGKVLYVSSTNKNSKLFIAMLEKLKRHYRGAKTITLILDNYIIHKSRETLAWLSNNPKFILLFQPVYSPWVNVIERLWNALHETVTRNHRCKYMWALLRRVKCFMDNVSPFPGGKHGIQKM